MARTKQVVVRVSQPTKSEIDKLTRETGLSIPTLLRLAIELTQKSNVLDLYTKWKEPLNYTEWVFDKQESSSGS